MAPVAHAGRVDARTVLLADDDEDFRVALTGVNDPMLPVRLDVPIAFKPDAEAVIAAVRQQLAGPRATAPERAPGPRP